MVLLKGETVELCKWTVDISSLPSFQENASMPTQDGFYTGMSNACPSLVHMIDPSRQILSLVWNWMALRSAGFYYTRVVNGAGLYLICCLDHTSFGLIGCFGHFVCGRYLAMLGVNWFTASAVRRSWEAETRYEVSGVLPGPNVLPSASARKF